MPAPGREQIHAGTVVGGLYELTRCIGRGGMSSVWAARHLRLQHKEVALKFLASDDLLADAPRERVRREAEILSRLSHPHIIHIADFDMLADGTPYLVLELLRGESLRDRLARGRLALDEAVEIATQVGSALGAAHAHGVIHRDLKPANVFLIHSDPPSAMRYHVKVLDFGIAALPYTETLATLSQFPGTPQYMAPEQLDGSGRSADERSDQYALGTLVYEMLTGRRPFEAEGALPTAFRVVHGTMEPLRQWLPHLSSSVSDVVERALARDPSRRFPNVAAFTVALARSAARSDTPPTPHSIAAHFVRRGPWLAATVGAVALVATLAVVASERGPRIVADLVADSEAPVPARENVIAVLEFENQRPNDVQSDWYRRALQTAFNTELSRLTQLAVVSPEEVRRFAADNALDPMKAARQLGARRFVTGSFAVLGDAIRIDARIVETDRGVMETADRVEGPQANFFDLQRQLTASVLERFQLAMPAAASANVGGSKANRLDRYRLLLQAEGVTTRDPEPQPSTSEPEPISSLPVSRPPQFALPDLLGWFGAAPAAAQEVAPDSTRAVRAVLEKYRQAHEAGDADALARLYASFSDTQRAAVSEYFKNVVNLRVELDDISIEPRGDRQLVRYLRRDRFVDRETGEELTLEVRLAKFIVTDGDELKFAAEE